CSRKGGTTAIVYDIQSGLALTAGLTEKSWITRGCRLIERIAFNRVDRLVVLSEHMKEALRANGVRTPIEVMPPQVEPDAIVCLPEPTSGTPVLVYSGNFGYKQGLFQLLDVAECLFKRGRNVRFVLRGDGSKKQELIDEIARRQLKNVSVEPLLPRSQLSMAMAEGIIHLVPQLPQGAECALPSKVFAIMAAGRPFIATALPDSPLALFEEEVRSGVCVEPFNSEAFANAVEKLLDNRPLRRRMGERGRSYVERSASTGAILDRFDQILRPSAPVSTPPKEAVV